MSTHPRPALRSASRSDRGPRARNEDRFLRRESRGVGVYAVADGMGGVAGGQVASSRAIQLVGERMDEIERAAAADDPAVLLAAILVDIDAEIRRLGEADPVLTGLGTTLTLATLGERGLAFAHAGDSRLFVAGEGVPFRRLTDDMNLADRLFREGRIGREEYETSPHRARLLSYLGKGSVRPQSGFLPLRGRAAILLATDGLSGPVAEREIADALSPDADPDAVASSLAQLAASRAANDNVTVVVAVLTLGSASAADEPRTTGPKGQIVGRDFESCGSAGSD